MLLAGSAAVGRAATAAARDIGADHPVVVRLDGVECQLWRAFVARVRTLAGEH